MDTAIGLTSIRDQALEYRETLRSIKLRVAPQEQWYPYDILANFVHIDSLLTGENRSLFDNIRGSSFADIGAADGDNAFFLEHLGAAHVDIIDNPPTNNNGVRGAAMLREALNSRVAISHIDLDTQFRLPRERYSVIFLLGILYHLKNPFYVLEALARVSKNCLVSTRITRFANDKTTDLSNIPVAYLVDTYETNNDPSNYWIFSDAGLKRIFARTGWDLVDYMTVGNTVNSDPATWEGDERAFALLRSRHDFEPA